MGFNGVYALTDAFDQGAVHEQIFFKSSSPSLVAGIWGDLSMGAGTPKYNAYVGGQLEGTPLIGSANNGIYCGQPIAGLTNHLAKLALWDTTAARYPGTFQLCDYLYFYPLVDGDSTDLQVMDNTLSAPRMPSQGARLALVCTTPQSTNNTVTATITYLNQANAEKSITCRINAFTTVGQVIHHQIGGITAGQSSPFVSLAAGDTGVRSVLNVQHDQAAGGFYAIVLVNPITVVSLLEAGTPAEYEFLQTKAQTPSIAQGAYLNFFACIQTGGTIFPRALLTFAQG